MLLKMKKIKEQKDKREKLIFDLYVKFSSSSDVTSESNRCAEQAIHATDILLAEMNKETQPDDSK